ncbi:hypothetical protein GGF32_009288 [Allomyces javanicus]|nr:hypothetical protein GGF32_009288 [Allomyces javanicus]
MNNSMWRRVAVLHAAAALIAGIAAAVGLWLMLRSSPSAADADAFCRDRADVVARVAESEVLGIVNSLNAFVSTAPSMSASRVQTYLAKVKPNARSYYSVSFYEHIPHDKRATWEAMYNASIYSSDAKLNFAPRADEPSGYWPVVYIQGSPLFFPTGLPRNFVGYDPAGEPTRLVAIQSAIAQPSKPILSPPVQLVSSDGTNVLGVVAYLVTKNRAITPGNFSTASMVSATLSIQDMFEALATSRFALHLQDGATVLVDPPAHDRPALVPSRAATVSISFSNRQWDLTCTPRATYGASAFHYGAWLASSGAMLVGAVLAGTLVTLQGLFGRHQMAEKSIQSRMRALQERAQAYLRAIPSPLIMLDSAGRVLGLNEHARDLFATRARQVDVGKVIQVEREVVANEEKVLALPGKPVGAVGRHPRTTSGPTLESDKDALLHPVGDSTLGPLFRPGVTTVRVRRANGSTYPADLCASDLVSLNNRAGHAEQPAPEPVPTPEPVPPRPGVAQVVLLSDTSERSARRAALVAATEALQHAYLDHGSMMLWLCHELRNPLAALAPAVERDPAVADAVATMLGAIEDAGALLSGFEVNPVRDAAEVDGEDNVPLPDLVAKVVDAHRAVAVAKQVDMAVDRSVLPGFMVPRRVRAATAHLVWHLVALAVAAAQLRSQVSVRVAANAVTVSARPSEHDAEAAAAIGPKLVQADAWTYQDAASLLDLHAMAVDSAAACVPGATWRRVGEGARTGVSMGSTTAVRRHGAMLAAAAAVAAGIASAVGLWLVLRSAPSQAAAARFCHDRADMVSVMAQAEVRSLNAFVSTAPAVTPKLLEQYLARVKPNPKTVYSVNFYERIPADKRTEWEAIYNTSIYSSDANLNYGPRLDDPNGYWPMVFLRASTLRFPSGLPRNFIGYDPSGEPTRKAVVLDAIAQPSQPFLTPPVQLAAGDGSNKLVLGFLVFLVTMKRAITPGNFSTASMVAASLSVQDLFSDLATGEFALHLEDGTTSLIDAPDADRTALIPSLTASATIPFANRRWTLTCTPRATYGESTYHYGAWLASSGAMAAGAVLAGVLVTLHGLFGRRRRAERSIHARMRALQERAQAYLRAIPSPLILLDAAGQVLGLNEHARDLFATRERQVDVRRVIQVACDEMETAASGMADKSGRSSPVMDVVAECARFKGMLDTHGPLFRPGVAAVRVRREDGSTYPADLCASDLVSLRDKAERAAAAAVATTTTTTCRALPPVSQADSDTSTDQLLLSPTDTDTTLTAGPVVPAPAPEPVPPPWPGVAQVVLLSDMSERSARLAELEGATAALQRAYLDHGSMILWLCHELRNPIAALAPAVERDAAVADAVSTMLGAIEDAGALLARFEAEPARDSDQNHGDHHHDVPLNQVVATAIAAHAPVAAAKHVQVLVASYASSDSVVSRHLNGATAHLVRHFVALAVAAARPRSTVHVRVDARSVSATATPTDLAAAVATGPRRAQAGNSRQFQDATSLLDLHAMAIDHAIARVPGAAWRRVAELARTDAVRWQVVALGGVRWRELRGRGPADRG